MSTTPYQQKLFKGETGPAPLLPEGFRFIEECITPAEEEAIVYGIDTVRFSKIEMHGVVAQRRAAHFGVRYSYQTKEITEAEPIPEFLLPLRARLADMLGMKPEDFPEALINEYTRGAAIGWHIDGPIYEIIVGVSLVGRCTFRLRRMDAEPGTKRRSISIELPPRSAYVMSGEARWQFQHSIPKTEELRYSITFRSMATP